MAPNVLLGLVNIGCAALFVGISVPLIRRKVGRNPLYGVRLPQSFRSDEHWYAINEYGGRQLTLWSLPIAAAGAVCLLVPLGPGSATLLTTGSILGCVGVAFAKTLAFARRFRPEDQGG